MKKALLIIDMLNDFSKGGSLEVAGTPDIVAGINALQESPEYDVIVLVQDWHPEGHCSFQIWPEHCVQGTHGADFVPGLNTNKASVIIRKGVTLGVDSYSAFRDNDGVRDTGLEGYLNALDITDVDVVGVATEYCVAFTAKHAKEFLYRTRVLKDLCRAVTPEGGEKALQELTTLGVLVE